MGYYSSRQKGSNLTSSEFKFQPKTRKLLSGILNQWRHIHLLSCCVCLCAGIIRKMFTGLWCWKGVLLFASDRLALIGTSLHPDTWQSEGAYWGSLFPPKVPGAWFGTNAPKKKCTWGTPVCVCMYGFVCVFLRLLLRQRGKTAGSGPRWSRTSSHGQLPVRDASQEADKPELLFIPHRQSKWSFVLSLIHTLRTHQLCSPVDFSCLLLSLLGSLLSS